MPNSAEFLRHIPNFNIKSRMDLGGTVANEIEGYGQMGWEADTSRGRVSFSLSENGLRAINYYWGIGAIYNNDGELSSIKVDILSFIRNLLDSGDDFDEEVIDDLTVVLDRMGEIKEKYIADMEVEEGIFGVYFEDEETGKWEPVKIARRENFDEPRIIRLVVADISFGIGFHKIENDFCVAVGRLDNDETVGNLKYLEENEGDMNEFSMIFSFISGDCNYLTYLDSKKPDRFERLAKRIFID